MSLRFFGRKRGSAQRAIEPSPEESHVEPKQPTPARTPRRRPTSPRPKAVEPKAAASESPPDATKPRSRRGRRGGVGRRKPAAQAAQPQAVEPARVIPLPIEREELPAGNGFEALAQRQLAALTTIQGSLSAIENRLAQMGGLGSGADRPRVGVFVDVPNVMYAAERERVKLDFRKVLDFIVRGREMVRASAYAPISDDPQAKLETQRFVEPFVDIGYRVVFKPLKRFADGSMKANFDVELAIDVLTMSDRLDIVTLVSGDGDFRRLVELVQSKGVRVEVVAFGKSTASELRAVADEYIDFSDHLAELRV